MERHQPPGPYALRPDKMGVLVGEAIELSIGEGASPVGTPVATGSVSTGAGSVCATAAIMTGRFRLGGDSPPGFTTSRAASMAVVVIKVAIFHMARAL